MPPNLRNTACFIWWVLVFKKDTPKWEHSRDSYLYYISPRLVRQKKMCVTVVLLLFLGGLFLPGGLEEGNGPSSSESLACDLALPLENRSQRGQWCYSLVMFMPTGGPPNSNLPTNTRVTWINRKHMPMGTKCHFQTWDGLLGELSHSANVGRIPHIWQGDATWFHSTTSQRRLRIANLWFKGELQLKSKKYVQLNDESTAILPMEVPNVEATYTNDATKFGLNQCK